MALPRGHSRVPIALPFPAIETRFTRVIDASIAACCIHFLSDPGGELSPKGALRPFCVECDHVWNVSRRRQLGPALQRNGVWFSGAAALKVEGRVLPVVRSRAQGISLETTVEGKVVRWCELSDIEPAPVIDCLQLLELGDAEAIAARVLAALEAAPLCLVDVVSVVADQGAPMAAPAVISADMTAAPEPSPAWLTDDLFAA